MSDSACAAWCSVHPDRHPDGGVCIGIIGTLTDLEGEPASVTVERFDTEPPTVRVDCLGRLDARHALEMADALRAAAQLLTSYQAA